MGPALRKPVLDTFTGGSAEVWERVRGEAPEAFGPEGEWTLHFHCLLLRGPGGALTLVDTGIGDADSPAALWAPVPGRLVAALAEIGVAPGDVGTVVLTHLHSDHASGAVAGGVPVFPNARHVVQARELAAVDADPDAVMAERVVAPLRDLLDVVDGDVRLGSGARVVPTPGHTPGHQSVAVGDVLVSGDVVLHPVQLIDPSVRYVYDGDDAETAVATRIAVLEGLRERGGVLAAPHLPAPFVRVK